MENCKGNKGSAKLGDELCKDFVSQTAASVFLIILRRGDI